MESGVVMVLGYVVQVANIVNIFSGLSEWICVSAISLVISLVFRL